MSRPGPVVKQEAEPVKLIATILAVGACVAAAPAVAHDGPPTKLGVIQNIYPDLHARELKRDQPSWNHLRRMTATRWRQTHRCASSTLDYVARRDYWGAVEQTWSCDQLPEWKREFLRCIPNYEGGRLPDVHYGGGRGYPGGLGNVVFGPWQVRPAWIRGAMEGRRGTYAGDYWSWDLYQYALNPVNMARVVEAISPSQYATAGFCS